MNASHASTSPHTPLPASVRTAIRTACLRIPPLFDRRDTIAVNPFLGLSNTPFAKASSTVEAVFHTDILPGASPETPLGPRLSCVADRAARVAAGVAQAPMQSLTTFLASTLQAVDEGRAEPNSLFPSYQEFAAIDLSPEVAGLKGYRSFVESLPADRDEVLSQLLAEVRLNGQPLDLYLTRLLARVRGYAGALRAKAFRDEGPVGQLPDLLAILLVQEKALANFLELPFEATFTEGNAKFAEERAVRVQRLEHAEEQLASDLDGRFHAPATPKSSRPAAQLVFCIDVRSERIRLELERTRNVLTYGFAGFFGLPLQVKEGGKPRPHCPPLLAPSLTVKSPQPGKTSLQSSLAHALGSPISSFGHVEAWGLTYFARLIKDAFPRPELKAPRHLDVCVPEQSPEVRRSQAINILQGSGLTFPLAPLVTLVGHDSRGVNNLQRGALACGACAGHSGLPNAQIAAALLNDKPVRAALRGTRWETPDDVLFLAAEHETVTDTLTLIVPPELNEEQRKNVATLQEQLEAATLRSRMKRFGDAGSTAARATSNYAEVQSELGLAGNAAFVVGRRELTRGVPLNGRAFLQSYDNSADSDDGTLTAILSGPAVVTSWINLQYYASTVAPDVFGAGRKTLHNLVGQFGVIEGGHGDLAIGLSRESLITPTGSAHAPLRLHLMVETSIERLVRCIQRVESIRSLAANEWIRVSALESSHGLTKRTLLSPVLFEKGCASSIAAE